MTTHFIIFDKTTDAVLATLPLTIPIGSTVKGFQLAGQDVGWRWCDHTCNDTHPTRIEDCDACAAEAMTQEGN